MFCRESLCTTCMATMFSSTPPFIARSTLLVLTLCLMAHKQGAIAFSSPFIASPRFSAHFRNNRINLRQSLIPTTSALPATKASLSPSLPLTFFNKLPWNVKKEQERQARRRNTERALLHRQLGIAEDATYEEIVAATDRLTAEAGSDLKRRVQIEVAKDKILQYRLNERLAGLAQAESKEARAMSAYELDG